MMSQQSGRLPTKCPSCGAALTVKRMACPDCHTEVEGGFALPILAGLNSDEQDFILKFVGASGSLKEMARLLGVSYPTVRNRLDEVIARLKRAEEKRDGTGG